MKLFGREGKTIWIGHKFGMLVPAETAEIDNHATGSPNPTVCAVHSQSWPLGTPPLPLSPNGGCFSLLVQYSLQVLTPSLYI